MPAGLIEYRPLGTTGLIVSQLSMGGSALGNVYGEVGTGAALESVRHGIDLGVNFLDTSPYYGDTPF
jgi:aryl-alcohol dehydrogenase-like predicted oxidoreductase